jgi:drug/metabolite transporter (DMT)-like permease
MSLLCILPAFFVNWTQFAFEFWLNVFFAGMLCTVGTVALIEALKVGELSVLAPINSYKCIIGLLSAFVLLGELPSVKEFICVFFIVLGSYFVLDTGEERFSLKIFFRRDVSLRIFALLCSGVEASFLKKIIILSSYKISLILWCFSGFVCALIILAVYNSFGKKISVSLPVKLYKDCSIIAFMLIIMQLTTNYVFSKMSVGVALSLFQLSSLVSLYFGYKVYHEKEIIKKLTGTVIMIVSAGIILVG